MEQYKAEVNVRVCAGDAVEQWRADLHAVDDTMQTQDQALDAAGDEDMEPEEQHAGQHAFDTSANATGAVPLIL